MIWRMFRYLVYFVFLQLQNFETVGISIGEKHITKSKNLVGDVGGKFCGVLLVGWIKAVDPSSVFPRRDLVISTKWVTPVTQNNVPVLRAVNPVGLERILRFPPCSIDDKQLFLLSLFSHMNIQTCRTCKKLTIQ